MAGCHLPFVRMLFILLSLFYADWKCSEKVYSRRKWELEDKCVLYLNQNEEVCWRPGFFSQVTGTNVALISDGTTTVDFTKASGKVKLADGRTALIGDDNYLRIIGSTAQSIETFQLGVVYREG
ncbi:hypothetical protein TVAG_308630 [Trichomonas vaginalis G3]|uniref:Uncharacterized protein n=1 Tax=Trichomonas vaginalis (strain ATCC PRA-98 / G3) TaxID=412133 RepID=A2FVG4_TRIV3|nr:uncharacterized protein TVAGG3_1091120 [Trichomonas vaginalis G3]EAX91103.1 hypothetical protein TVAG_308630 [Trichomonas vaginalis G3]KAI5482256.1 hypothetical protein TVAGG3_1091120 [Trichomonas vaginalis G3]|eukprot:XP_001304033.1 hypothetical protein [Trichomonas vaginalis G3]